MQTTTLSQSSERLEYIDLAKGIGIILVVIGHSVNGHGLIGHYISSFHMPLFFLLSGLCFSDSRYPTFMPFLKKRVKTLLLPCLYFTCIMLILSALFLPSYYPPQKLITYKLPGAYWFILILFLSELFYFIINRKIINLKGKILFIIGCFCISVFLHRKNIILPYNICSLFIATFFYGAGHLLKDTIHKKVSFVFRKQWIILLLIIPAISVYFTGKSLDLSGNNIPYPEVYYTVIAFIGIAGTLAICNLFSQKGKRSKQLILNIGKNTLIILMMHMFFISLCSHYIMPFIANKPIYKLLEQIIIWILLFGSIRLINIKGQWLIGK